MKIRPLLLAALLMACGPPAEPEASSKTRPTNSAAQTEDASQTSGGPLGPGFAVWESNRSGSWRLWYRELEGGEPRQLTPDEDRRIHCCPHISPDGESIVYLSLPPDQKLYPKGGAVGRMDWIRADGSGRKTILDSARNYYENRAAVWRNPDELIYLEPDGNTARLDLETGRSERLTKNPDPELPWLLNRPLAWAASGIGGFGEFNPQTGQVAQRNALPGCQPYFSHDGRWVFWVQAPGGPLAFSDLASGATGTLLKKSDPRLPTDRGYLYFPMLSSDGRLLAFGASPDQFNHFESDYDIFVIETDPDSLEILGEPIRITDHPATDRFPDVWVAALPLGRQQGEAPFRVQLQPPDLEATWQWDLGDGSSSEGASFEHLYKHPGRYIVQARADGETLRGLIVVTPSAAPESLSVSLRNGGREVVVVFDEAVDIAESTWRLSSGIQIEDSSLDSNNRRLRLRTATPIMEQDQLELAGIQDRAQQPNRIATMSLPIEPPFWPTRRDGLVFLFQTANAPNLVHDVQLGADTSAQLQPRGRARLDHWFSLLPSGGFFAATERDSQRVVAGGKSTNELTIEAVLEPQERLRGKTAVILASGTGSRINFRLEQRGSRLVFVARKQRSKSDPPGDLALFPLAIGKPNHITVTFTPGELRAYLDGEEVLVDSSLQKGFHHWRSGPLTVGSNAEGRGSWPGRAEGLAIYNRILAADEVRENYLRYQRNLSSRVSIETWRVQATRLQCSPVPTLDEIQPYREALTVCTYKVEEELEGTDLDKQIRVAQWSILDGDQLDLTSSSNARERQELLLSRFSDNPQLESLYLSDTLGDASGPTLYYASTP